MALYIKEKEALNVDGVFEFILWWNGRAIKTKLMGQKFVK